MSKKIEDILEDFEEEFHEEANERIEELERKVMILQKTLETYGIVEEVHISNVEFICQKGIETLKRVAQNSILTQDDAKTLDILHKNLRSARGQLQKKEAPGKTATEAELLQIVKGVKSES